MLDWYFASDDKYLGELPVLDSEMKHVFQQNFKEFTKEIDIIIGSDLIYFDDSIEPLINMIKHLFASSSNPDICFYVCMKLRSH